MADMTLEEALAAATVDEELVTPVNEVLMINPETRTIHVPDSEKLFGARQDMSVERKYFKCPRIVGDNIDLFEHRIFVNYVPSKQDGSYDAKEEVQSYWCGDLAVEGDFVTFSWKLSENVTRSAGYIAFAVYAKTIDEYGNLQTKWHTTIAIGNVLDTLPDGEEWVTFYPDIVMQLLERMDEVEKIATEEAMQGYVDDYFNRNPMMIDRELKDATKAAPADIVGKLSEEIVTKASAIKEKASGELIVITDSDEAKPLGLAIDGKSEQNQYSGKNLFNVNGNITGADDASYKKENGTISVTTNETLADLGRIVMDLPVDSSKTYTLSFDTDSTLPILVGWYGCSKHIQGSGSTHYSITLTEITTSAFTIGVREAGATVKFSNIQVEEGSTKTAYEQYCGGIPSPNPSYPQEIRNIGVYDEASRKYKVEVKCTGKNLLKNNAVSKIEGGITFTVNEDGSVILNGTALVECYLELRIDKDLRLKSGNYILSGCPSGGSGSTFFLETNANGWLRDYGEGKTFTINEDVVGKRIYITIKTGMVCNNVVFKPMIRYAEITDNTYEPYKETTATVYLDEPLRGIGGYKDNAYISNGKLKVVRKTKEEVLTGGFTLSASSGVFINNDNSVITIDATNQGVLCGAMSERYIPRTWLAISEGKQEGIGLRWMKGVAVRDSRFSTADEFNAHIAENPLKAQFILAEPTTEEIDINLDGLSMFYPTTIISNDCNANMEVTYIADTKAYIDKKFAELATAMV